MLRRGALVMSIYDPSLGFGIVLDIMGKSQDICYVYWAKIQEATNEPEYSLQIY
jgi:hypothetical protein